LAVSVRKGRAEHGLVFWKIDEFNEPEQRWVIFAKAVPAIGFKPVPAATSPRSGCAGLRQSSETRRTDCALARFASQGRELWDEGWLREHLQRIARQGYESGVRGCGEIATPGEGGMRANDDSGEEPKEDPARPCN
jgi:hypothetical protein